MGQNLTPIKSHAEFPSLKISRGTTQPRYAGTITNLQIVLNTPKNPYLNQATQKHTCQNFPTPKNPEIENFHHPPKPSIIPVTWNLEYPLGYGARVFLAPRK